MIGSSDERLAHLVAESDDRAFAALYDRHHQALYRYCRFLTHNEADAQDALQSTWAQALSALRRGQRDAPVRPWLYRIAHNEAISILRRRGYPAAGARPIARPVDSAEHQMMERERFLLLVSDLRELPDRPRGALVMRELSGLSHEEIATVLGTSTGAAKQSILEARKGLADFAAGRAMPCDDVCRRLSDGDGRMRRGRHIRAHLRECSGCAAFAASITDRRSTLRALTPTLPAATATSILAQITGHGHLTAAGGGAGAGLSGASTAGIVGKSGAGAVAVLTKALAGAALVTVTAGALGHVGPWAAPSGKVPAADATTSAGSVGQVQLRVGVGSSAGVHRAGGPVTKASGAQSRATGVGAAQVTGGGAAQVTGGGDVQVTGRAPQLTGARPSVTGARPSVTGAGPQVSSGGPKATSGAPGQSTGAATGGSSGDSPAGSQGVKARGLGLGHQPGHSHGRGRGGGSGADRGHPAAGKPAAKPGSDSHGVPGSKRAANPPGASRSHGASGAGNPRGAAKGKAQSPAASAPATAPAPAPVTTPPGQAKKIAPTPVAPSSDPPSRHGTGSGPPPGHGPAKPANSG